MKTITVRSTLSVCGLGHPRSHGAVTKKSRGLQARVLKFLALRFLHSPVLHVTVDVGVELTASENAVETGGLGSG